MSVFHPLHGHDRLWPIACCVLCVVRVCLCACVYRRLCLCVDTSPVRPKNRLDPLRQANHAGPLRSTPCAGPLRWTAQKFSLFCPSPVAMFVLSSLWGLLVELWPRFKDMAHPKCVFWAPWSQCAKPTRPLGFANIRRLKDRRQQGAKSRNIRALTLRISVCKRNSETSFLVIRDHHQQQRETSSEKMMMKSKKVAKWETQQKIRGSCVVSTSWRTPFEILRPRR